MITDELERESRIRDIIARNIKDRNAMIESLLKLCRDAELAALESAQDSVVDEIADRNEIAENEWREIVASFERGDMSDVRQRLMDMGQRAFGVDVFVGKPK